MALLDEELRDEHSALLCGATARPFGGRSQLRLGISV